MKKEGEEEKTEGKEGDESDVEIDLESVDDDVNQHNDGKEGIKEYYSSKLFQ